ncbi:uncharacterized protein N7459_004480 [Penicillium hispanicum]|uniref:uncharacterized protein n=1 Tax=Penicillium hispanicum TaxID=1080232 RepID=UPI0025415B55|nr:uncharacterized protein N7459_004480 [Penicillium hispanicum]KAJ5584680.1 hypothetical protein N7459_004480 [Penicillium hispanicum]
MHRDEKVRLRAPSVPGTDIIVSTHKAPWIELSGPETRILAGLEKENAKGLHGGLFGIGESGATKAALDVMQGLSLSTRHAHTRSSTGVAETEDIHAMLRKTRLGAISPVFDLQNPCGIEAAHRFASSDLGNPASPLAML